MILCGMKSLYNTYTFEGTEGQFIRIQLDSDDFDTYLILLAPDGDKNCGE
jgi:hypothetical protein